MKKLMVAIARNPLYGESCVTVIGLTRHYGGMQYVLVSSDNGNVKFPGLRYRAAAGGSLADAAQARFEEQTGLRMTHNLGLRVIMPTRGRHSIADGSSQPWVFRNIFLGVVEDLSERGDNDADRRLYVADVGRGIRNNDVEVSEVGKSKDRIRIPWVADDNREVAQIATDLASGFDWERRDTNWYRRIPCVGAEPLTDSDERPLGCGLAVASMVLLYKPSIGEPFKVILLKRKGDEFPGYPGGKIETPASGNNLDPISCCMAEGIQETGFGIRASGIICCAHTPLSAPDDGHYVGIENVAFAAEPINPNAVRRALENPRGHLEGKMDGYVVETLTEFRDRVARGELRMPDMEEIGREFFGTPPGQKIPLTHIRASGAS